MPVQRCYVEYIALNVGAHLISSSEGVQRDAGGSIPLGVVATATNSAILQLALLIYKYSPKIQSLNFKLLRRHST